MPSLSGRCPPIGVDQSADVILPFDRRRGIDDLRQASRRHAAESLMRPLLPVVAMAERDDAFLQCLFIQPDRPAGEAGLECSEPALDETIAPGRARRGAQDFIAVMRELVMEAGREAGIYARASGRNAGRTD